MTLPSPWNAVATAYSDFFTPRAAQLADRLLDLLKVDSSSQVLSQRILARLREQLGDGRVELSIEAILALGTRP